MSQSTGNPHGPGTLASSVRHLLRLSLRLNGIRLATVADATFAINVGLLRPIVRGRMVGIGRMSSHWALDVADRALHLPRCILRWVCFDTRGGGCIRIAAGIRDRERLTTVICFLREAAAGNVSVSLQDFFCRNFRVLLDEGSIAKHCLQVFGDLKVGGKISI